MDSTGVDRQIAQELGVYVRPGLGRGYPELSAQLLQIYADKVAVFGWVPASWLGRVRAGMVNGDVYQLLPPRKLNGTLRDDLPAWITDVGSRVDAWEQVSAIVVKAIVDYATQQAEAGREELDALYRNAAFWDGLYRATKVIADLPADAVSAATTGAQYVAGGVLKSLFSSWLVWAALIVGGGLAAWRFGLLKLPKRKGA